MAVDVKPLSPTLGAEITGVDLARPLAEQEFAAIRAAYLDHGVIVFRDQHLTPEQQLDFSRRFGALEIHVNREFCLPQHPEIVVLSNVRDAEGRPLGIDDAGRFWHSDLSYMARPSLGSMLYAFAVPEVGGDTLFASMYAAYDRLPADVRAELRSKRAVHSYVRRWERDASRGEPRAPLTAAQRAATPDVMHPIVRRHPDTGRPALFVNEGFTFAIEGMDAASSERLLGELFALSVAPDNVYRHRWRARDVVMWDNRAVIHSATPYPRDVPRHMHRTTVRGGEVQGIA